MSDSQSVAPQFPEDGRPPVPIGRPPLPMWLAAAITITCLAMFAAKLAVQAFYPDARLGDPLSVGLLVIAAAPWLAQLVQSARVQTPSAQGGAQLELVFRRLERFEEGQHAIRRETQHLATEQEDTQRQIAEFRFFVASMLPKWELRLLYEIYRPGPRIHDTSSSNQEDFRRDLGDLFGRGFIKQTRGEYLPWHQGNLNVKDYYAIDTNGLTLIGLRERLGLGRPDDKDEG